MASAARTSLIAVLLLAGCSAATGKGRTYLRFTVDHRTYVIDNAQLVVWTSHDPDRSFLSLGTRRLTTVPGGMVQWRMGLTDVDRLAGRQLDLSDMRDTSTEPVVQFVLSDDASATQDINSRFLLRIERVMHGYVEGSFTGRRFNYVSLEQDDVHDANVDGTFRARVVVQ
ncbi:MAG: hypothetical protein P8099_16920 [Gemmatimonadota bacterium]|jgi:hypothetical protein